MINQNSVNKVTLAGVVYKEPIVQTTNQDVDVTSILLMTVTKHPKKDETFTQITPVSFYHMIARAVAQAVSKGDYIYIEGKLYIKKNELTDGTAQQRAHVVADHFIKLKEGAGLSELFTEA
jgi:Single-stranded DNA-binding protein